MGWWLEQKQLKENRTLKTKRKGIKTLNNSYRKQKPIATHHQMCSIGVQPTVFEQSVMIYFK